MRSEVIVQLGTNQEFRIGLEALPPMAPDEARRWLDELFIQLQCEPLRATGKLLTADRVLCVAQAAGAQRLGDPAWASEFARAVSASLGKPAVRVDVPSMTMTY